MVGSGPGTGKMLAKLEKSVRAGSFYEAQQMYKSVSARYVGQGKVDDALDLLQSGACLQLEHHQVNCGVELGIMLVDTMDKSNRPFSPALLSRLVAVHGAFTTPDQGSSGDGPSLPSTQALEGATEFLKKALRWSMRVEGGASMGAPELHDCMAECLWGKSQHKDMSQAAHHFVLGTSPDRFAHALSTLMLQCFPDELDLVAARAVLQYLATGNLRGANSVLEALQNPTPGKDEGDDASLALPDSPLMHFLQFLLLTVERDAYPLFKMLQQHYQDSLHRDPSLSPLLDEVAHKFFGVRKAQGGFLGDLMQMLMAPDS